jgi:hypothetical protein
LREYFHVYVDERGLLRTEHEVRFLGLTVFRIHYKLERVCPDAAAVAARERAQPSLTTT